MYVCICNGVTDHQIRDAVANGCRSMAELTMRTGAGANCGTCLETAAAMLEPAQVERAAFPISVFPIPMLGMSRAA